MAVHDSRNWSGNRVESGLALRNLLHQLHLVDIQEKSFEQSLSEEFPIAFYAQHGFFQEEDAIRRVAEKLTLEIFYINAHAPGELMALLDTPPANLFSLVEWKAMRAIPISISEHQVTVAMADPLNRVAYSQMHFAFGRTVEVCIGRESDILKVLNKNLVQEEADAVELIVRGNMSPKSEVESPLQFATAGDFESSIKDEDPNAAPVVKLVNRILSKAISSGASDLHFTPTKAGIEVKARIDGIMQPIVDVPEKIRANVISRIKLLCGMDISERRRPQDGRLRINTHYGVKDLRVSSVPSAHGENIVARILSSDVKAVSFEELALPTAIQEQLTRTLKRGSRVNLVTGPTGSGKTSTLYASLLYLHDGSRNIITLEDPIEYRIDGITQIQVNNKIDFGFAEGLRSILRQDPDVVLVGEVRDEETASISMKTAQTGHLVLSTLHTNTAAGAVTRLLDLGVPAYLIASSLGSVLAQRLVRRVCNAGSAPMTASRQGELHLSGTPRVAVGCEKCRGTGYSGRIGVFSFLDITDDVAEAIRSHKGEEEIERCARRHGFQSLGEAALLLVEQGVTTFEEAERVVGIIEKQSDGKGSSHFVQSGHENSSNEKFFAQPRVLLVEDDNDQREIFSSIFESEMFQVLTAVDGKDALEKLMHESVDLVVCDVMMPRLDGHEFVKRLRGNKQTKDLPVLMLTAANTEQSELESITRGADDFLAKTSSVNVLLARARRLIERAQVGS